MDWYLTPYTLLMFIPPAVLVAMAAVAWRRRVTPGARPLAWMALVAAIWSLTYILRLHSANLPAKLFWNNAEYLGIAVAPSVWLAFVLKYTGRGSWLTRRTVALLAVAPLLTILTVWTNGSHSLYFSNPSLIAAGPFIMLHLNHGPLFWVNLAYSYSMLLLGGLFLFRAFLQAPPWIRGQAGVLLAGGLVPWAANALYHSGLIPIDLTSFSFSLIGLAMLWGLLRLWLSELTPVAREAVIRAMDDGMIVLDAQHRIIDLNPAAERIVGRPAAEAIGQPAAKVVPGQLERAGCDEALTETHLEIPLPDTGAGTERFYDVRCSPLRGPHEVTAGYLLAWRDITERRQAEEALRRSNAELQARNEELDAFAHTVAHNLKDSLSIVVGAAGVLKRDRDLLSAAEVQMWLRSIWNHGTSMSRTTEALLLLARVRQGQFQTEPVEMAAIVAKACQRLASTIDQHQVEIVTPAAWPAALGYGPWLEEVWANLIDNAIKYGGLPPRIELGYALPGLDGTDLPSAHCRMVRFWVRDNGPGLTSEEQACLFLPFTALPRSRSMGHGLGLSIVRRVVEKMGGQVGVSSEGVPGRGSVFYFALPGVSG